MKKFIVILVAIVSLSGSLFVLKGEAQWVQNNGPNGGWCESMCLHNGYLFANAHGSVIFRSSDNGDNWSSVYTFPFWISQSSLTSQGSYLFIATSGHGVLRSSDNGVSWTEVNNGFPYSPYSVEKITTSGQYLIGGRYKLFRSSNYGNNWDSCTTGLATPLSVYELSVIGSKVYIGTTKGAYVSTNNGESWSSINNGITTQTVNRISSDGTSLYASTSIGIFKSTNEGLQWYSVNNGLPTAWFYYVIFDGSYLLATTLSGRYRYSNGGQSWDSCNNGLTSLASVSYYISGSRLFSILWGGAGIQYTTNHGSDWIVSNNGFYNFYSDYIAVKDNILYTCGYMQGLATSSNDGTSWQYISNSMIDRYVRSVAANNSCVFISTGSKGLLKTTNNGINWISCNNGIDSTDTKVLYAYDDVVFASNTYNSASFRTTNNGANWTGFYSPNTIQSMARIGDVFLAGNSFMEGGGLIRSTDKGFSWIYLYQNFLPLSIVAKDSIFYLYNYNGFHKSTNLGLNWVPFSSDLPTAAEKMYVVDNKLVCISGPNIYTSSNNGTNWISKRQGLPYLEGIESFVVKGSNVFLSTSYRSVWKMSKADLLPVENISEEVPTKYSLVQNYPNPFNNTSNLKFEIVNTGDVKITVYDMQGREVQTLVNERLSAGTYEVKFDGSMLTSGVYFYKMVVRHGGSSTGDFTETKRMILIK
jgi:photosystem II stability/assembly factor-like uncharacterized protein